MSGFKPKKPNYNQDMFSHKHRVLIIEPQLREGLGMSSCFSQQVLPIIHKSILAGAMIETCSVESFVWNVDKWKNAFDMIVLIGDFRLSYICPVDPADLKNAIEEAMDAGVFFLYYHGNAALSIYKYNNVGAINSSLTVDLSTSLDGLSADSQVMTGAGTFELSQDYPFGGVDIRWADVLHGANGNYINHYTSTDPNTIFPVLAVEGATIANITAYKPGKFMVIGFAGQVGTDRCYSPLWKYVDFPRLFQCIAGKAKNSRFALGSIYGKKIASIGVDCCATNDIDSTAYLMDVFEGKPIEFGLVYAQLTDDIAQWYRTQTKNRGFSLVNHTYAHFADATVTAIAITETHVIPNSLLVRPNHSAKISNLVVTIDATTITASGSNIDSAPTINQYAVSIDGGMVPNDGGSVLKFHPDRAGQTVSLSYTTMDDVKEFLSPVSLQSNFGCMFKPAVFLTGINIHPATYEQAKNNGIIICNADTFGAPISWYLINRIGDKRPLPVGAIMQTKELAPMLDISCVDNFTKAEAQAWVTEVINYCIEMDFPLATYFHNFLFSETYPSSVWVSTGLNADWKKATLADTRAYLNDFYEWVLAQFDAQDVCWLPRSEYVQRYQYCNEFLQYDIKEEGGKTIVYAKNAGKQPIEGATFKIPMTTTPQAVNVLEGYQVDYSHASGMLNAWTDIAAGETVVFEAY